MATSYDPAQYAAPQAAAPAQPAYAAYTAAAPYGAAAPAAATYAAPAAATYAAPSPYAAPAGYAAPYAAPAPYGAAPQYGVPPLSNPDEPRTLFVTGFPTDVKERELNNLLRFLPGYEVRRGATRDWFCAVGPNLRRENAAVEEPHGRAHRRAAVRRRRKCIPGRAWRRVLRCLTAEQQRRLPSGRSPTFRALCQEPGLGHVGCSLCRDRQMVQC